MEKKYFKTKNNSQTSDVIDLSTRRSGLDFLMDYNDMVRCVRNGDEEGAKKLNPLAKFAREVERR